MKAEAGGVGGGSGGGSELWSGMRKWKWEVEVDVEVLGGKLFTSPNSSLFDLGCPVLW